MKNTKTTILFGFVLMAIVLISIVLFPVSEKYVYDVSPDKIEGNYSLYILDNTHSLRQSFQMRGDFLQSFSFFATGYDESSSESICIKVKDDTAVLYEEAIPLSCLDPNNYTEIDMNLNLVDGHDYYFEFSTDGKQKESSPRIIVVPAEDSSIKYGGKKIVGEKIAVKYQTSATTYNYKHMSIVSGVITMCLLCGCALFQRDRKKISQISVEKTWGGLSIISLFVLFSDILISHGDCLSHFFFYDEADVGMDFFSSIVYLKGNAPYKIYQTLYPPLANALFSLIYHCIPENITAYWPLTFEDAVEMRQTSLDLRVYQAPVFLFILFVVFSVFFMCCLCKYIFHEQRAIVILLLSLFSFGYLVAFERGNIVVFAFICTVFFIIGRHSDNPVKRELSYISLALAAGLKLYPALYGLLLIKEKKWKESLRTVLYGVLAVVLPCFLFDEKIAALKIWGSVLVDGSAGLSDIPWIGNGMTNMVQRLSLYVFNGLGYYLSDDFAQLVSACILLFLLFSAMLLKNDKYSIFLLTVVMSSLRPQGDYIFIFYLIPLYVMIRDNEKIVGDNLFPTLMILLFTAPIPLFYVRDIMYPRVVLTQALYVGVIVWTICMNVRAYNRRVI